MDVLWTFHQDAVMAEIAKILKVKVAKQGDKGWFESRMKAMKRVWNNMSPAEQEAVNQKKIELSEQGFPESERPK